MHYATIDFETSYTPTLNLRKCTLRKYLADAAVLGMAIGIDGDTPVFYSAEELKDPDLLADLRHIAESDDWTVVAHNAAFDVRVWRFKLGLPQPRNVLCTLELAHAAFPNQDGGYSLDNLGQTLLLDGWKKTGKGSGVMKMSHADLAAYCCSDVVGCQKILNLCLPRLHPDEIKIALLTNQVRELWFEVDEAAVATAFADFSAIAHDSATDAITAMTFDGNDTEARGAFGWEDSGRVKSVKPQELKRLLAENLGFDTQSISFKKINPEKLRGNATATTVLKATERANKALSHQRRVNVFRGVSQVDAELGYFRAHTGRFSSPSSGRGLNLHNLSKRDKRVAKAIRSMFRLPDDVCFVRADLANVEYRIEGLLTGCEHTANLFGSDVLADPYSAFGYAATGKVATKLDAIRQVWKAAVLGLGYGMGVETWIRQLLMMLADHAVYKVVLADLEAIAVQNGWQYPGKTHVTRAMTNTKCPPIVATVAYHTLELFHRVHPEFKSVTRWLQDTVGGLNQCNNRDSANRLLDARYQLNNAPDRNLINLHWTAEYGGRTVRVTCGHWPAPTVTWRDIDVRPVGFDGRMALTFMSGRKGYWPLSPSMLIENVTQSAARNALCAGMLELQRRGHEYQLSVHDEILLVVPKTVAAVLKAKQDILDVFGPGNSLGWGWAVVVNPAEINVSSSLYELELGNEWWAKLPTQPELLEILS